MPGRRRSSTRRYRRFKRAYRKGGVYGVAKQAAKSIVKYYLNPEYKFLDSSITTPFSFGFTGVLQSTPTLIGQGDADTQRNGNSVKVTSMLTRGTIELADTNAAQCRFIIFTDTSSNGAPPAVTDLLQSASVISPLNRINGKRFRVLYDRSWVLDADNPKKQIHIFKKMQHHIHYLDSTANTSSLGQGPIYFLWISDQNTNAPLATWNNRFRFLDN